MRRARHDLASEGRDRQPGPADQRDPDDAGDTDLAADLLARLADSSLDRAFAGIDLTNGML